MNWYLALGIALTAWTLLLVFSSERQRRLMEIEARRQQALLELQELQRAQAEKIPTIR
jgi:hypothetical protein